MCIIILSFNVGNIVKFTTKLKQNNSVRLKSIYFNYFKGINYLSTKFRLILNAKVNMIFCQYIIVRKVIYENLISEDNSNIGKSLNITFYRYINRRTG